MLSPHQVLDVLVYERYVKEQELGPRLKLPDKEVQRVLQKLEVCPCFFLFGPR